MSLAEIEAIVSEIEREKEAGGCMRVCSFDGYFILLRGRAEAFKIGRDSRRSGRDDYSGRRGEWRTRFVLVVLPSPVHFCVSLGGNLLLKTPAVSAVTCVSLL